MAIGMPRSEFWYGDPGAAREYRTAYRLERDSKDYWAWRQGAYVYEAILDVAPILRAFSKAKRPEKYPDKPYGFGSEKAEGFLPVNQIGTARCPVGTSQIQRCGTEKIVPLRNIFQNNALQQGDFLLQQNQMHLHSP